MLIAPPKGIVRVAGSRSFPGGTTVARGTFEQVGGCALHAGGEMTVDSCAVFDISGLSAAGATIVDLNGAGTIALGDKSLTVGTANSSAFSGGISGTDGSLIKQDSGTQIGRAHV